MGERERQWDTTPSVWLWELYRLCLVFPVCRFDPQTVSNSSSSVLSIRKPSKLIENPEKTWVGLSLTLVGTLGGKVYLAYVSLGRNFSNRPYPPRHLVGPNFVTHMGVEAFRCV